MPITLNYETSGFDEAIADAAAEQFLEYSIDPANGILTGNPGFSDEVSARAIGAVVKINSEYGQSSGFIVGTEQDERVVITAGHAVGECAPDSVTITDTRGNTTTAAVGRYVLEQGEVFSNATNKGNFADLDIAVIRARDVVGSSPLALGETPGRGEWLNVFDFHGDAPYNAPHRYKAVVMTHVDEAASAVLTGMEPERKRQPRSNYVLQRGGSGGVMLDSLGHVAGMLCFSSSNIASPNVLKLLNVSFTTPIGGRTGIYPRLAFFMQPSLIRRVARALND